MISLILNMVFIFGCNNEPTVQQPVIDTVDKAAQLPVRDPLLTGIPDINMTMVNGSRYRKSEANNNKGMKYYKRKKYEKASEYFIDSLEEYPGNMLARFNLACTYVLNGEKDRALAILKQLRDQEDCLPCKERLLRAKVDKDFETLWNTKDFTDIVEDVTVELPDYEKLARKFIVNMGKSYWKEMVDAARADQALVVLSTEDHRKDEYITNRKEIQRFKRKLKKIYGGTVNLDPGSTQDYRLTLKCSKVGCCRVKVKDPYYDYGEYLRAGALQKVCFRATSSETAYVNVVEIKYSGLTSAYYEHLDSMAGEH